MIVSKITDQIALTQPARSFTEAAANRSLVLPANSSSNGFNSVPSLEGRRPLSVASRSDTPNDRTSVQRSNDTTDVDGFPECVSHVTKICDGCRTTSQFVHTGSISADCG